MSTSDIDSDIDSEYDEMDETSVGETQRGRKTETIGLIDTELKALNIFTKIQIKLKKIVGKFHTSTNLSDTMTEFQLRK